MFVSRRVAFMKIRDCSEGESFLPPRRDEENEVAKKERGMDALGG